MGWRDWWGLGAHGADSGGTRTEVVARIARALDALPSERARFVAAFAYHLGRVAHADHQLTDAERDSIGTAVARESGLPVEQVALVVDLVVHESLAYRGTEDYRVLREFDELSTFEEKLALVRCMFAVSAADARVVTVEDNEIRRIALALNISHEDFVQARVEVREHLAVLKKTDA